MRSLLILVDGLGDDAIAEWGGRTPYEEAKHPYMDALQANGTCGAFSICENDIIPESCSCILRLLGVQKEDIPQNRAYLELLAQKRDISEYEMVLRCNLAVVDKTGKLVAFNGAGLTPEKMQEAAACVTDILKDIEFIHLSEYRNLLIMSKESEILATHVAPPHESVGQNAHGLLAELCEKSLAIKYFLTEARKRLACFDHDGLEYILYPWGASARQTLPSFTALHGLQGAAICKAEIVRGIACALGMQVVTPAGATGDVDTDVAAKAAATLVALKEHDFVLAHFNGSDEASHRYDYEAKKQYIEKIDEEFLARIASEFTDTLKIIVCGDHVTSSVTGKHGDGVTPVIAGYLNKKSLTNIPLVSYRDILNFLMKESE